MLPVNPPLSDDLLKHISEGSGRCYPHEAKSMAEEILSFRQKKKDATASVGSSQPQPWKTP